MDPIQSSLIKGRYTLDSVTLLHEIIHYMHRDKKTGVLFKVDFDKAYEINWDFMYSVLEMKGFPDKFFRWTKAVFSEGKICIMVNDVLGKY